MTFYKLPILKHGNTTGIIQLLIEDKKNIIQQSLIISFSMKFKYANYSFMIYHEYRLGFPWLPQILYNQKIGGKILMVLTKSYTGIGKRPTLFLGIQFHQYR